MKAGSFDFKHTLSKHDQDQEKYRFFEMFLGSAKPDFFFDPDRR